MASLFRGMRLEINTGREQQRRRGHAMSPHLQPVTFPSRQQLLKVSDVAALLNVRPRTICEMVAQQRIPYRKPPGSNILRFDLEEVVEWTKAGISK
jgi:excisionase family DNA binding protein